MQVQAPGLLQAPRRGRSSARPRWHTIAVWWTALKMTLTSSRSTRRWQPFSTLVQGVSVDVGTSPPGACRRGL
ncbi:hypothetical protein DAI22_06g186503 [Oryza sativa Japonica Group]|nr:hypothetical protein DAI22_06g186503 [Oryza sativa Japonica Group]